MALQLKILTMDLICIHRRLMEKRIVRKMGEFVGDRARTILAEADFVTLHPNPSPFLSPCHLLTLHHPPPSQSIKTSHRHADIRIMPLIILSYFLNYIDRTGLGSARTLNNDIPGASMVETLNLKGSRYNTVVSCPSRRAQSSSFRLTFLYRPTKVALLFIGYCLFEFPSNLALKYFTPSRWIARILSVSLSFRLNHGQADVLITSRVSWGIVTICTAAVTTYEGEPRPLAFVFNQRRHRRNHPY